MWQMAKDGLTESLVTPDLGALISGAKYIFSGAGASEDRANAPVWTEALTHQPASCVEVVAQRAREADLRARGAIPPLS